MSSVCVLTPIVGASWPVIASSIAGAASAMGFTVAGLSTDSARPQSEDRVETDVPNSDLMAETLARGEKIRIARDGVTIEFGIDDRGKVTVCASGAGRSKADLKRVGQEVAGRVVQQFAYHKLVTELKQRGYEIAEESIEKDHSIQIKVRSGR